jgi:hypothetical protein
MDLIVETDLGRDPDDFFALCYLAAVGVDIRAITISPGDLDQVSIARLFCKELGLDIPVGVGKLDRKKQSSGGMHYDLLEKYGYSKSMEHDGAGAEIIRDTIIQYPESELFIIGPATSVGKFLANDNEKIPQRATMQGGFISYDLHDYPCKRLEKFEGKTWVPTFNLNGDRKGGVAFIEADIPSRRFIGKNVCHTIVYDADVHKRIKPKNRASELFKEGMDFYLMRHDEKKFHDPAAAVGHLYPKVFSWVLGKIQKMESGWGTTLDGDDFIAADVDYDQLWEHITTFK